MSDYISRADAMKPFQDRLEIAEAKCAAGIATICDAQVAGMSEAAIKLLKDIPTADVRPVVRGEWISYIEESPEGTKYIGHRCSVCNEWEGFAEGCNFCPNCGAKMKGE